MNCNVQKVSRYAWAVVALLWPVVVLNYLDRQMLSTMRLSIMKDVVELQSAEKFGWLMAAFLWIYAISSPMGGAIGDRLSRKWLIIASLGVWSLVTLLMGFSATYQQLFALRAVMGLSEALYMPAGLALIADYHRGPTRSLAVGAHLSGVYIGQALGGIGVARLEGGDKRLVYACGVFHPARTAYDGQSVAHRLLVKIPDQLGQTLVAAGADDHLVEFLVQAVVGLAVFLCRCPNHPGIQVFEFLKELRGLFLDGERQGEPLEAGADAVDVFRLLR